MINPEPLKNVHSLPSYSVWLLRDDSIIICKTLENYKDNEIQLSANLFYALVLVLARKLQTIGVLFFIEKARKLNE